MPGSSTQGKQWLRGMWTSIRSKPSIDNNMFHILDVGPGQGTYFDMFKGPNEWWTAIEVFYPYVEKYQLDEKYDKIIISDIRYFDWYSIPAIQDVIIFGDVLEHMMRHEALSVINKARERAKHIMVSIPVGKWPQGVVERNPYERHVDSWTYEELQRQARYSNLDGSIGTYII